MPLVPANGSMYPESVPITVGMFRDEGGELVWNGKKVDLRPGEAVSEIRVVTAEEIAAKRFTLTAPVDGSRPAFLTLIDTGGGSLPQIYGIDYRINEATNQISWDGYGLDGLIAEGDTISIIFFERV